MTADDQIVVRVQDNWITLSGKVDWAYQREEAEKAVRRLSGVRGIIDLEARSIRVSSSGGKVTLEGRVKAWYEKHLAERTAWSAPGVIAVEDRIAIG